MSRERAALAMSALLAVLWALFLGWPRATEGPRGAGSLPVPPTGAPNVVVVVGCTVRKDQMTVYGGPPSTTPFLAERARAGVRFADALSTSSWTREAAVGLLTGTHADSVGMSEPGPRHSRRRLPRPVDTLAERFRAGGWFTLGLTANPNLNRAFGFAQGFAQYADAHAEGFSRRHKRPGARLVRRALLALDRRSEPERPFYLQLVLIDPHTPRAGDATDLEAYRRALGKLDEAVAALAKGLDARGHADDTLWTFVADHGEGLSVPAHHGSAHGKRMYSSTVEIPWLVWGPGIPSDHVVEGIASGVDVPATMLGLVGLPSIGEGRDWSAQVRGEAERTQRTVAHAASRFLSADVASSWTSDRQCQSGYGSWRHHPDGIARGCHDRRVDPGFQRPIDDPPALAALDEWRAARIEEAQARRTREARVDPPLQQQLEALGYRDEEAEPAPAR